MKLPLIELCIVTLCTRVIYHFDVPFICGFSCHIWTDGGGWTKTKARPPKNPHPEADQEKHNHLQLP